MSCYDRGFVQAFIDGELSRNIRKKFMQHLESCKECQRVLLEISKLNQWENVILGEESLHPSKEIKGDVEEAWNTFQKHSQLENISYRNITTQKTKTLFKEINKKSKRFIYMAVATVGLFTTAMIPQVQVAATNAASYFSNEIINDKVVNEGIRDKNGVTQDMMKNGQYISIDEKITDQDITVHFKKLYIADSRISVHYRMEKADGNLVPYEFGTTGAHLGSDGKVIGHQEENPEYNNQNGVFSHFEFIQSVDDSPFRLMENGKELKHIGIRYSDKPVGVITFVEDPEGNGAFKQPLTINININKIGKVAGAWKGQIQIDSAKLK